MNLTEKRKEEHINQALNTSNQYVKTTGFECVELIHNALPELDFEEINTDVKLFGRRFSYPFYIAGMTGGYKKAGEINKRLAKIASEYNIPLGLGSQRAMVENPDLKYTYDVKKDYSDVFLIGNIGGVQLKAYSNEKIEYLVKSIELDALAIHLNPLQEIVQPEGDKNFSGIADRIVEVKDIVDVPIIIKEVGAGISRDVALRLKSLGINIIDVGGSGGTSWAKIEIKRGGELTAFAEWGIPTALAILTTKDIVDVIATGGIRNGLDGAKAIALGGVMFGSAYPFLKAVFDKKESEFVEKIIHELKVAMFLTGSKDVNALRNAKYYITGWLNDALATISQNSFK